MDGLLLAEHPAAGTFRQIPAPVRFGEGLPESGPAPRLGEHGLAVLAELGYTTGEIDDLISWDVDGRADSPEREA